MLAYLYLTEEMIISNEFDLEDFFKTFYNF